MIAQRVQHGGKLEIADDQGKAVTHTPELVTKLFDEELEKLVTALPAGDPNAETFRRARKIAESMIVNREIDPI
jgi:hypothetical protein